MSEILSGMIMLWSGAIVDIPAGWILCDGTLGTPDLLDLFVRGAGNGLVPGATGGAATHTHDFTADSHFHDISAGTFIDAGTDIADVTDPVFATGTTDAASSLPPYYSLAFIMKT